ncbi:class I SAM-dependent methyltransferase [Paludisphaera mucosa]|uniref:Class I SAM-dependent methyltransferase n=1 Tax=Paludisphaera mucosa TaxID=3030827 RepID=A0ABT6FAV9_9BACT|nr:class I SAM-dependent methyltransferase [Paludisphaera mucosa]MDG3004726.1 class I SAM-dependent methyltransferase [Paludisphaera mucosa]
MRDHNKAFCRLVAETFDCPAPIVEFGSYQVEGQEGYANLRGMFAGKPFIGCDMRPGPGVDRIEDVSAVAMPDASAGAVLCLETFEHVFEVRRAFDEVFRILKPGGVFVITSPLNFRIHAYPDDYWRMTPSCLKRMMRPYDARIVGSQGFRSFPHSVMAMGIKAPAPADFQDRARDLIAGYRRFLAEAEAATPFGLKIRRRLGRLYRSKGERQQAAGYYHSEFGVETGAESVAATAPAQRELRVDQAVNGSPIPMIHDTKGQGAWRHPSIVF